MMNEKINTIELFCTRIEKELIKQKKLIANNILREIQTHACCTNYHEIDGKKATCLDMTIQFINKKYLTDENEVYNHGN